MMLSHTQIKSHNEGKKHVQVNSQQIDMQQVEQLISAGHDEQVRPYLEDIAALEPDNLQARYVLARIAFRKQDFETAHSLLWDIVERDPFYFDATVALNQLRIATGQTFGKVRPRLLINIAEERPVMGLLPWADIFCCTFHAPKKKLTYARVYDIFRDTFSTILKKMPHGWEPDLVLFFTNETFPLPLGIQDSPYPTVCLPCDCFPLTKLAIDMEFFDAVLPGLRRYQQIFKNLGHPQVLYRAGGAIQGNVISENNTPDPDARPYDVVFIGDFGNPYYARRTRFVERLIRLKKKYNILVSPKKFTLEEYYDYLGKAKIVIETTNVQGGVNMRSFEATQYGAMLMHEELDGSITEFFEPGEEVVLFDEDNFEQKIEYYLENDEERRRIALKGWEKASQDNRIQSLGKKLVEELRLNPVTRRKNRKAGLWSSPDRFNRLGISDFYANIFDRAVDLFQLAIQESPGKTEYINNLAVACYHYAIMKEDSALHEKSLQMLQHVAGEKNYFIGRFNLLQVRNLQPDAQLLSYAAQLVDDLEMVFSGQNRLTGVAFSGLLFFPELAPVRHLNEYPPEAIAIEQLLEKFPEKDERYVREFTEILLWKSRQIYADLLRRESKFQEAETALRKALEHAPENPLLWDDLGRVLREKGDLPAAEQAFRRSLEILPLRFETELVLVQTLFAAGKMEEAKQRADYMRLCDIYTQEQYDELRNVFEPKTEKKRAEVPPKPEVDQRYADILQHFMKVNGLRPETNRGGWNVFVDDYNEFFARFPMSDESREFKDILLYPQLNDRTKTTPFDAYYFYQDTWAARKIFELKPSSLVDVASRIDYVGLISGFVPTTFVDIRPLDVNLPGLTIKKGDILDLPFESNSVEMISSLSVVEHIGLGRYGDEIMPDGSRRACAELLRVVRPGGYLLIAVPAGKPLIAFNAHRIFSCEQILSYFPGTKVIDEIFLYPTPGPRDGVRFLKPGKFIFYCFLLQKENSENFHYDKQESTDNGNHRPRWFISG